jgi:uncharacterized protein YjbJ (UPF0337 family)
MSFKDRISGRLKKATGDLLGNRALQAEGAREERRADAKQELAQQQDEVARRAARVSELERRSDEPQPR